MRVLVVDDDLAMCENLTIGLRAFGGHEVTAAQDLASATNIARSQRFQAAFVDLRLPEGSGIDVLRTFVFVQPEARAFLMSAYQHADLVVEALMLGAVFVPKWLDIEHFARLLSHSQVIRPSEAPGNNEDLGTRAVKLLRRNAIEEWADLIVRGLQSTDDPRTLEIWCRATGVSRTVLEERHARAGIKAYNAKCLMRLLWATRAAQLCNARPIDMLRADARTAAHILGGFATDTAVSLHALVQLQSFVCNRAAVAELARRLPRP